MFTSLLKTDKQKIYSVMDWFVCVTFVFWTYQSFNKYKISIYVCKLHFFMQITKTPEVQSSTIKILLKLYNLLALATIWY